MERDRQREPKIQSEIDKYLNPMLGHGWRERRYTLITGHRRENLGEGFLSICKAIQTLAQRFPSHRFIYPVHLNPRVRETVMTQLAELPNVILLDPLPYRQFVALMNSAHLIVTDSGGIQEEAPALGKPVLVTRENTERPEGVQAGTVKLVGTDATLITQEVNELLTDESEYLKMSRQTNPYGDGKASQRIVAGIKRALNA
jgi:UDP-N-acetylglucosamine 2-epimerase (non-hydrolysing)